MRWLHNLLHPPGLCAYEQELLDTIDECVLLAAEVERLEKVVAGLLAQNTELRKRGAALHEDLLDLVDLRANDVPIRLWGKP